MAEMAQAPSQEAIKGIIEKRLVRAPEEVKARFPAVLRQKSLSWATISEPQYLLIVFLDPADQARIAEFMQKRLNPFPGLITTRNEGAAFRVENSRNMTVASCSVSDSFTFSLGPDSTIVLENHFQSINARELGKIAYTIPLAYILSYGSEISSATLLDYLEGLVTYSTTLWSGAHGS